MNKRYYHRVYYLNKSDIDKVGGLLYEDEEFRKFPGESALWISQYGRIISKRKRHPRLLSTVFQKGYYRITLPFGKYGVTGKHMYYVHSVVAEVFCNLPEWIHEKDKIEVHHIEPVDRVEGDRKLHYASNLMYVPRKLHKAFDTILKIDIKLNSKWVTKDLVTAAEALDMSPYEIIEEIGNEKKKPPIKTKGIYSYYMVNGAEVRIVRRRVETNEQS